MCGRRTGHQPVPPPHTRMYTDMPTTLWYYSRTTLHTQGCCFQPSAGELLCVGGRGISRDLDRIQRVYIRSIC